ncbi:primase C-terminal domain-containing protein, partial [Enterococcus sp. LJL90]
MQIQEVYSLFLKQGIRQYKFKNSKIKPIDYKSDGKKGAIFGFRSKEKMAAGRGVVLTSEEAILDNLDGFTHWTPNVYSFGTYADKEKSIVKGHAENNLKQINTFL